MESQRRLIFNTKLQYINNKQWQVAFALSIPFYFPARYTLPKGSPPLFSISTRFVHAHTHTRRREYVAAILVLYRPIKLPLRLFSFLRSIVADLLRSRSTQLHKQFVTLHAIPYIERVKLTVKCCQ